MELCYLERDVQLIRVFVSTSISTITHEAIATHLRIINDMTPSNTEHNNVDGLRSSLFCSLDGLVQQARIMFSSPL
jgi:hypothetical protein